MKSAKEMFEELGYKLVEFDCCDVCYNREELEIDDDITYVYFITFKDKTYSACKCTNDACEDDVINIDMKLFKAIQKQLEELGWLDES